MSETRRIVTVDDTFHLPERVLDTLPSVAAAGTEYVRNTPAATWSIIHNLQRRPSVIIYDASGAEVEADVVADTTSVTITFPAPVTGSVVLI
jgi:hypothetical protein